ncbi:MAG: cell division protein FtsQ/DivIB [Gammaproteobacteria bacterium]
MPDSGTGKLLQGLSAWVGTHRRSWSGLLLLGMLGLTSAAGMRWLSDPYRFPLDVVEVKGEFRHLQKVNLQAAVAPHTTGGFFTVDVDSVRAAAEELPWVHHAKVRRIWPASLRVHIFEQRPVVGWNGDSYLNDAGEVFTPRSGQMLTGLPQLAGPDGQAARVLQRYREASRTLQALNVEVTHLAMDRRRAWSLQLDNGVQLKLGRARPWDRLQRFVRAYPDVFDGRLADLKSVDMRYSNGFSVYWQPPPAGEVVAKRDI